uniref:Uncharacterized protein n=1 Tax=Ascaris suum TaxID=6253 RepID=F1LDE5_ASCSU
MAMNLEEAIVSFPDLLWTDPPNPVDVQNPGPSSSHCVTEECVACQQDIRRRLTEIGLAHFNVPKRSNTRCTRYHFSNYNYRGNVEDSEDSDDSHSESWEERNLQKQHHLRKPRYAERNFVGTRFNISCVRKGNIIGEEGLISLCSSCWAWRTLPSNYIPQILNELICDTHDDACLSGMCKLQIRYAKCKEGVRDLEVIRNDSGVLTTVLLTSGTYCECRATRYSPIYNLIIGSDVNGK